MHKVTEERRREIGKRIYEIGLELMELRKEIGANNINIGTSKLNIDAWSFLGTIEEGAGGLQLDAFGEKIEELFIREPVRVLDECSVETLEKAHECFGWEFPNGEVEHDTL